MSSAKPTRKRYVDSACHVGTGGFGRSGQMASLMPQWVAAISAGEDSPGVASNWRSGAAAAAAPPGRASGASGAAGRRILDRAVVGDEEHRHAARLLLQASMEEPRPV